MTAYDPPRTVNEATRELLCQRHLHALHVRLYRRLRFCFAFISAAAGSAAVVGAIADQPMLLTSMGMLVAAASLFDTLGGFAERQFEHEQWRRQFADLETRIHGMTVAQLGAAVSAVQARCDVDALSWIAWHDTLRRLGYEHAIRSETLWQRVVRVVA